jgi:uncharacterized protein YnzC (UPF0291/DUF896 family)
MTKRKIKIIDNEGNDDDLKLQILEEATTEAVVEPVVEKPLLKRKASVNKVKELPCGKRPSAVKPVEEEVKPVEEEVKPVEPVIEVIELPFGKRPSADEPAEQVVKPDKKVRVQELVECPDCKKMITPKSFKYSHKKTCGANKETAPVIENKKPSTKKAAQIQEIQETPVKAQPLTAEEKRKQTLKSREERLTNLFTMALKK